MLSLLFARQSMLDVEVISTYAFGWKTIERFPIPDLIRSQNMDLSRLSPSSLNGKLVNQSNDSFSQLILSSLFWASAVSFLNLVFAILHLLSSLCAGCCFYFGRVLIQLNYTILSLNVFPQFQFHLQWIFKFGVCFFAARIGIPSPPMLERRVKISLLCWFIDRSPTGDCRH